MQKAIVQSSMQANFIEPNVGFDLRTSQVETSRYRVGLESGMNLVYRGVDRNCWPSPLHEVSWTFFSEEFGFAEVFGYGRLGPFFDDMQTILLLGSLHSRTEACVAIRIVALGSPEQAQASETRASERSRGHSTMLGFDLVDHTLSSVLCDCEFPTPSRINVDTGLFMSPTDVAEYFMSEGLADQGEGWQTMRVDLLYSWALRGHGNGDRRR